MNKQNGNILDCNNNLDENDINPNIQLKGIDDKKKYLKYYFENINKANLFLEILIDNINKQHSNDHILLNK